MPRELTEDQVGRFRNSLSALACELFVERGYSGVTMRELARHLGCSPMTPYRYFSNKAEIFDAVRSACFARFGEWLESEMADQRDLPPLETLRALGRAYIGFALAEPRAYRMMFEVERFEEGNPVPEPDRETWYQLLDATRSAVDEGAIVGEPEVIAHLIWATLHGIVSLHHTGRLRLGKTIEDLVEPAFDLILGEAQ